MSFPLHYNPSGVSMKSFQPLFRIVIITCLLLQSAFLFALDVPPLTGPVNDYARLFNGSDLRELNNYLYALDQKSDLQIAILTIPSLEDENLEDYSIRVAEQWKIGQKGKDSGVIFVIAAQEHKLRIEVGYGLEGLITDAQSSRIIRSIMIPAFQKGEYGKGTLLGVKNVAGLALQDESLISQEVKDADDEDDDFLSIPLVIILIVVFLFGARFMPGGFFWPLLFLSSGRGGRSSGGFGGGSGRGGSGFSGGGGRFGGGGSSGSW